MMQKPLISVIMPNNNFGRFIGEAISSVTKQSFQNYELLIIDNGSTDQSRDVINYWASKDDKRIRPYFVPRKGLSFARNLGLSLCKGDIITFLDSDDVWHEDYLATIAEHFEKNPSAKVVYTNARLFQSDSAMALGDWFDPKYDREPLTGFIGEHLFRQGNFVPIDTAAVKREVVSKAGGFDERFRLAEDLDFWMRVSRHFPFQYVEKELCRIRRHSANSSFLPSNAFQVLRVYRKNLALQPELAESLGERVVNKRFYALYYEIGRRMTLLGRKKRARIFFRKALCCRQDIVTLRFWLYYPLTYCFFLEAIIRFRSALVLVRQ
jgi:glycosyltransferase involved in cell wall biosynthesis